MIGVHPPSRPCITVVNVLINFPTSRLQGDGLCDRRNRPCKKVTVFGTDFLNSTNLTCHVKELKVCIS